MTGSIEVADWAQEGIRVVQELRSSGETLARETKQQCRGWVDAALGKLESLAIRSREQLATLSAELPFTVKRLVAEEMAPRKGKVKVTTSPRRVSRRSEAPAESLGLGPQTPPFELGEPLAFATRPVDSEIVSQPAVTHHGLAGDRDVPINETTCQMVTDENQFININI
eukprot:symbB.v1.2.002960.t1/scaffold154.1/size328988/5